MSDILFTDKQQIGFTELKCDIEYRYVPKEDYQMLIDLAWRKGEHTAKKYRIPLHSISLSACPEARSESCTEREWSRKNFQRIL